MPLASQPGAQLVVAVPPMTGGMSMPVVGGGGGAAGLGLILLVAGLVTGKRQPAAGIGAGRDPRTGAAVRRAPRPSSAARSTVRTGRTPAGPRPAG